MFQTGVLEKINTQILCSVIFFLEDPTDYEIMWKNTVELYRSQMTIQHMRIACWIPKATNTHSEYVIFIFQFNNVLTNTPECYITRTWPVWCTIDLLARYILLSACAKMVSWKMS